MMEMEKAKRRNEKVWTSLLFHFSLFLFTFTLSAGHPSLTSEKACVDDFFTIPSKFVDDLAVIPGDADFYQVLGIDGDAGGDGTWTVTTNGVLALGDGHPVMVSADGGLRYPEGIVATEYKKYMVDCKFDSTLRAIGYGTESRPDVEAYPWRPGLFDFAFRMQGDLIRFTYNGDSPHKLVSQITGLGDLYHPRSFRLDNHTYMALLTSYAAYFERLYYASEGQTNAWDDAGRWGDYGPSDKFVFSLTNSEYSARNCYFDWPVGADGRRAVEDCRKLKEWARNRDLRAEIRDDMFRREIVDESDDKPVNPDFVYRPGWLLDREMSPYPYGQDPARGGLWWTSQADPPKHDLDDSMGRQTPTTSGFHFFPEFDWTDSPVSLGGAPTRDWSDYCVTFNMSRVGDPDYVTHPLLMLFKEVGYEYGPDGMHLDAIMIPYDFCDRAGRGFYHWMTNAYPRCVSQFYDADLAFDDYRLKCFGLVGDDPPRRLVPNDYVGINQVLGAMNRTLHIPDMIVESTNRIYYVERRGTYSEGGERELTLVFDGSVFPSVEPPAITDLGFGQGSVTNDVRSWLAETGNAELYVYAGVPDGRITDNGAYVALTNPIAIADSDLTSQLSGEGTILLTSISPSKFSVSGLDVGYVETNDVTQTTNHFWNLRAAMERGYYETNVSVKLEFDAVRTYTYERPEVVVPRLGPTQPGKSAGDRCSSSQFGMLSSASIFYYNLTNWSWTTESVYKAGAAAEYKGRSALEKAVAAGLKTQADEMYDLIPTYQQDDPAGATPDDFETYAPLPSSFDRVTVAFTDVGILDSKAFATLPLEADRPTTNSWYTYWFNAESNVVYFVYHVDENTEVDLYHNKEYYITNYVASGALETNRVEDLADTVETYSFSATNYIGSSSEVYPFEVKVGPLPESVEFVVVTNQVESIDDYRIFGETQSNILNRAVLHVNYMSGTGPDDPGWDAGFSVSTNIAPVSSVYYHESRQDLDKFNFGWADRVPVSEASHVESTNILLRSFGVYIDYDIDEQRRLREAKPFRLRQNLLTGEVFREDLPFPLVVGALGVYLHIDIFYDIPAEELDFGGPTHDIEMRGDGKIITQTDWQWKNLKRTDQ